MRLVLFVFYFVLLTTSCRQNASAKKNNATKKASGVLFANAPATDPLLYPQTKNNVLNHKKRLLQHTIALPQHEKISCWKNDFITLLADSIIPFWYGTTWDFNGTTETPGTGKIACGYFVTTTLRDMGYKLNRYRVAQMASTGIIQTLVQKKYVANYSHLDFGTFIKKLTLQGRGVYVIGLDNHVGYLYNDGTVLYFIHATFVGKSCVMKEVAGESPVLAASKYRVTGKICDDERFLKKWLEGK
jgi:hypothetical protein